MQLILNHNLTTAVGFLKNNDERLQAYDSAERNNVGESSFAIDYF